MKWRRLSTGITLLGGAWLGLRLLRPWMNTWGATEEERQMRLPGEEFLQEPQIASTHAITIHASPEEIWPWLVQMGQGRAGFYSYAWLENLVGCRIQNAERIHPNLQSLKQGDRILLHPKGPALQVTVLDPNRTLALEGWIFQLRPLGNGQTRLLTRTYVARNMGFSRTSDFLVRSVLFELAHFVMGRKQLETIKQRVEEMWDHSFPYETQMNRILH